MKRASSRGFKLTKVILAVIVLAVSAMMSNSPIADDREVVTEQSN